MTFNPFRFFFGRQNTRNSPAKNKRKQLLELELGSFVQFNLIPDICDQLLKIDSCRYDKSVLEARMFRGMVKGTYTEPATGIAYVEVLGMVIWDGVGSRREFAVLETDVDRITVLASFSS